MRDDTPDIIKQEVQLLESKGYRLLLTLQLVDPAAVAVAGGPIWIRLTALQQVTWQGNTYESIPFSLSGVGSNSDGTAVRPKLVLPNPSGVFSRYAHRGWFDNAIVTRLLIRNDDLIGNVNSFSQKSWKVFKVLNVSKSLLTIELRGMFDGVNFKLPPRAYFPPDFPHVSLQ